MSTPKPEDASETSTKLPGRGRAGLLATLLLFALALGLRGRAVDHGMPRNYVPDTHIVRSALGMAKDKSLAPPVGQYSTYPNLLPYLLLPAYGSHFALGRLKGDWGGTEEYKIHLAFHPESVHRIARWLMVLLGAATPFVIFRAARAAGFGVGAWASAWFVATGLMHLHFSVQERPWVAVVFFAAASAWPAALYVSDARRRWLLISGLCAALSAACHQSGLFVLALPGLAWLLSPLGWKGAGLQTRLVHGVLCVALFFALTVLVGYPSYLLHGAPSAEQTIGGGEADASIGGQSINFARRWQSFPNLARAFFGYEPVLSLLALFGLPLILRRRRALPLGLFALGWAAFFMTHSNEHVRYLLPLAVLLSVAAGAFFEWCWNRGAMARALIALLAAAPLVQAWQLGSLLARDDTRVGGESLLAALPAGALVAIDRYGPAVDLDLASLELLEELRQAAGSSLYQREALRLEALRAEVLEGGVHGVHLSDLFEIDELAGSIRPRAGLEERLGATVDEAFQRLGVTHLLLVNRLSTGTEESLLASVVADLNPSAVIRPFREATTTGESRLPMELEFPLTSIWELDRPGPWMGLFELPGETTSD